MRDFAFFRLFANFKRKIILNLETGGEYSMYKKFISVFICLITREIYLEVLSDYTTDAFISIFFQLIVLVMIYNDTNFVGVVLRYGVYINFALSTALNYNPV